jgi:hypothetical protein
VPNDGRAPAPLTSPADDFRTLLCLARAAVGDLHSTYPRPFGIELLAISHYNDDQFRLVLILFAGFCLLWIFGLFLLSVRNFMFGGLPFTCGRVVCLAFKQLCD